MNSKCSNQCAGIQRRVGWPAIAPSLETLKCVIAVLLFLASSSTASAATLYWNTTTTALWSGTSNWSTAAWSGGTSAAAPTSADIVYFNQQSVVGNETIQLSGAAAAMNLQFQNSGTTTFEASATGTQSLTIGATGITMSARSGAVTIGNSARQVAVRLSGTQTWAIGSSSELTVLNELQLNGAALTFSRWGNIGGVGRVALAGPVTGTSGQIVLNESTLTLAGSNSFVGGITVNSGGQLNINQAYALGSGTLAFGSDTTKNKQFDNTSGGAITVASNNPMAWNSTVSGQYGTYGVVFIGSNDLNLGAGTVTTAAAHQSISVLNGTLTMGGAINSTGAYQWEKNGAGKLILTGSSGSHLGTAVISAGTLQIDGTWGSTGGLQISTGTSSYEKFAILSGTGTVSGTVTTGSAATEFSAISLANGSIGSMRIGGGLVLQNKNNLLFDLGSGAVGTDRIIVSGLVSATNATVGLNQIGGVKAASTPGTYTLVQSGSAMPSSGFRLATTKAFGQNYSLVASGTTLSAITSAGTAGPAAAFWSGASNATWSTASNNWKTDASAGVNASGVPGYQTNVTFSTTSPVAVSGTTTLGSDFDVNSLTFLAGAPATAISGTHMLTIEAADFNGNTAGNGIVVSALTSGTPTQTIAAKVGLASSQTWSVGSGARLAVTGTISDFGGGYSLTKTGDGTLFLSGASSYSGGTVLNGGTLLFDPGGSSNDTMFGVGVLTIQSGTLATAINGALLKTPQSWNGNFTVAGSNFLMGNYTVPMLDQDVVLTVNNTLTLGGLSDRGNNHSLTKSGTGTLVLVSAGGQMFDFNYSGGTILNEGTLQIEAAQPGSGPLTINGGRITTS